MVGSRSLRKQWIEAHDDFRQLMAQSQVPEEYFQVKFFRRTYLVSDDSTALGLHVRAKAGVICLIQPLTVSDSSGCNYLPFEPDPSDTTVFAFARLP
jgi:hypothetical protein